MGGNGTLETTGNTYGWLTNIEMFTIGVGQTKWTIIGRDRPVTYGGAFAVTVNNQVVIHGKNNAIFQIIIFALNFRR